MRWSFLAISLLSLTAASWAEPVGKDGEETITCRTAETDPFGECRVAVTRAEGGDVRLHLTAPNGLRRIIHYRDGLPSGSDAPGKVEYERNRDTLIVRIGQAEAYEVPDRLVLSD